MAHTTHNNYERHCETQSSHMVTRNFPRQLLYTYASHPISSYTCVLKTAYHISLVAIFYVSSTPFLKNEYDFIIKGLSEKNNNTNCVINIYVCYPKHVAILELCTFILTTSLNSLCTNFNPLFKLWI